jgi:hypothetical protein
MESKIEKYISDCCSVEDRHGKTIISSHELLTPDQALRIEIAKKEIIEKACEWLEDNLVQCWIEDFLYVQFKHHEHQEKENVLADFRKAMEE